MARLGSESKAGFYATPPYELELLLQRILPEEGNKNGDCLSYFLYDPCCGEGEALLMIAQALQGPNRSVITYGSEIEAGRAEEASRVLDHVIHDGYQRVRAEAKFSLLWLNPPYQTNVDGERAELSFLRALTDFKKGVLQKGGLLLFCIPQYVLTDTAGLLSGRFRDISVYRFTDEHYDNFKQVIVVARYERAPRGEQTRMYRALQTLGNGDRTLLPTLEEVAPFIVPSALSTEPPYFRRDALDVEELNKDLECSSLFQEMRKSLVPTSNETKLKRPMLPLKPAHMGIALAAGAVGGNMGSHSAHCS
ncbi:DUF6094 domain-containing protein [Cohnella phaseoli]|uniref:DUF6094 domain-containing protein n=1 Tax=Cohnella phaseoli TaxID=456490 RepID=A0A3D9JQ84_9BACL|nr:DUF6094 domain-containing protein [Cohnella phaseoli]RED76155.1 hypothetical protein DFP98_113216 [Cohnella phaseoli]